MHALYSVSLYSGFHSTLPTIWATIQYINAKSIIKYASSQDGWVASKTQSHHTFLTWD